MPTDDTYTVVLRSTTVADDARITVRVGPDWKDGQDVPCTFDARARQWEVSLPVRKPPADVVFKFLCHGQWQEGPNLSIAAAELTTGPHIFDDRSVSFPNIDWLAVDVPMPARKIFDRKFDEDEVKEFDTIVVGSGAGGGTLAHELAPRQVSGAPRRVLVLEAGSYLFPTHVGNLPRRETRGSGVSRGIWDLWYDYRTLRWSGPGPAGESAAVSQAFNLGGRTVFWGALSPRAKAWELRSWPSAVSADLRNVWYEEAEQLMRVRQLGSSVYQSVVRSKLKELPDLREYSHIDAPVATEFVGPAPNVVPAGVFSTAELLVERKLQLETDGRSRYPHLWVRLNHEVTTIEKDGDPPTARAVCAYDHRTGRGGPSV